MNFNFRGLVQAASIAGAALFLMAASAAPIPITFNTSAAGTGFGAGGAGGLTLTNSSGEAATLVFTPNIGNTSGVPTNVNLGNFVLACATCSIQSGGIYARFAPFAFEMLITDLTDGAVGKFTGTSMGGDVYHGVSPLNINWAPLQLGTGINNALSDDFGPTSFTTTNPTWIVAPNSGDTPGQTTVQASLNSSAVPEPATIGLIGCALVGLGTLGRKRLSRQSNT